MPHLCVEDLDSQKLPQFISVSQIGLLNSLHKHGFSHFKFITQIYFLPLELPLIAEARHVQRAECCGKIGTPAIRAFRKVGGRHWIERQLNRIRNTRWLVVPAWQFGAFW
jgi:hypothetical protein